MRGKLWLVFLVALLLAWFALVAVSFAAPVPAEKTLWVVYLKTPGHPGWYGHWECSRLEDAIRYCQERQRMGYHTSIMEDVLQ